MRKYTCVKILFFINKGLMQVNLIEDGLRKST